MSRPSEDALIARFFAPLATEPGAAALTDDAAVLPAGPGELVVTKDMLVAGVHFFADDPPDLVARKALRVNLSDLAAKGALPAGFLIGLGLPPDWTEEFLQSFASGLGADIDHFGCPLFGGDTVKVPGPLTLSITAFGRAKRTVRRDGAWPGDLVVATGTIGDGALGLAARGAEREPAGAPHWLQALDEDQRAALRLRYLQPEPRSALAEAVSAHASAAMDISDGFAGDLAKLAAASGVRARRARRGAGPDRPDPHRRRRLRDPRDHSAEGPGAVRGGGTVGRRAGDGGRQGDRRQSARLAWPGPQDAGSRQRPLRALLIPPSRDMVASAEAALPADVAGERREFSSRLTAAVTTGVRHGDRLRAIVGRRRASGQLRSPGERGRS